MPEHRSNAVAVLIPYRHLHPFVMQNLKLASVHDIMDYPWPCDSVSRRVFEKALAESVKLERIKPMHVLKVPGIVQYMANCDCWYGTAPVMTVQEPSALVNTTTVQVFAADAILVS